MIFMEHKAAMISNIFGNLNDFLNTLFLSKIVFHVTLWLHMIHYQQFLPQNLKTDNLIVGKGRKYVWWAHGLSVFAMFEWFPTLSNCDSLSPLHYIALSALVVLLWDLGIVYSAKWSNIIPGNLHHVAVIIVLLQQPYEAESEAWYNTWYFSWIWLIHSFGILNEVILPLFGIRLKEGQRLGSLVALRHIYSIGTVYLLRGYLMGEGQPGIGLNYQTVALVCMLWGRYIGGDNWRNVAFFRRVECPGSVMVFIHYFMFCEDKYMERSFGVMLTLFLCFISYKVFFTVHFPKPAQYRGPFCEDAQSDPGILNLMKEFRSNLEEEFPGNSLDCDEDKDEYKSKLVGEWFDGQQNGEWIKKYPLFRAVAHGDKKEVEKLLDKDTNDEMDDDSKWYKFVNKVNTDWHDEVALWWAIYLEHWSIILLLLESGADPYLEKGDKTIIEKCFHQHKSSKKRRNILFGEFFEKLNVLSLFASPSVESGWADLPISERIVNILKQL